MRSSYAAFFTALLLVECISFASCGGGGSAGNGGGTEPPPAPTVALSTSSSNISLGQSVMLTWSSTNATSCSASGAWSGSEPTSNSQGMAETPSATGTATYTLTCTGEGGTGSSTVSVTVGAPPTITSVNVSCDPTTVLEGQTSQCSATVHGTGSYDPTVAWAADLGTVVSSGKDTATYTAPSNVSGAETVTATSSEDKTKSGSTGLKVVLPPPSASFQVIGPGGGDILSIAQDPTSPTTLYATAFDSGIYKSSDGAASWQNIGANFPLNLEGGLIDQIKVSADTGTVYITYMAGSGAAGRQVYKTADGGKTWTQLSALPSPSSNLVSEIVLDPLNDTTIYAVDTQNGLYRSQDAGSSWTADTLPASCGGVLYHDIATEGKLYFGSTCSGLYGSEDMGSTWTALSSLNNVGCGDLYGPALFVQARSNPQRIYATALEVGPLFDLLQSSDGGATWTQILQGYGMNGLVVYPSNPDEIFLSVGDVPVSYSIEYQGLINSLDGGNTWTQLGFPTVTPGFHYNTVGPLFLLSTSPDVFAGQAAYHVWLIQNAGSVWSESDRGLTGNFGLQVALDPSAPTTVYLASGNGSGISKSSDGGKTWTNVFTVSAESVAVDPFDSNHILTGVSLFAPLSNSNSPLQVSNDGGVTWADNPVPTPFQDFPPTSTVFDPSTTGTIYIASAAQSSGAGIGIAKSTDGGASWSMMTNGLDTPSSLIVQSLAIDPSNPQILLAGTDGGIYKTTDGGSTWTLKDSSQVPYTIAFDGSHAGYVYASGTGLTKSTDNGETWSQVNLGRSDLGSLLTLAVDPGLADTLFLLPWDAPVVGWSPDGGATWFWLTNGLGQFLLGGNGTVSAISKTAPEVLYIPSNTVGLVSLTLQH
jgi:photosystem II stability/assembly factor-like uncharacterized protein